MAGGGQTEAAFYPRGAVAASRFASQINACSRLSPHISSDGCKPEQHAGRCGWPNRVQRKSPSRCRHGTPAGLFSEEIDGAMQQAAQAGRQSKVFSELIQEKANVPKILRST
jgi:hypothetical protein